MMCCMFEGAALRTLQFPAKKTTSCCFGGPGYSKFYVTSGCTGLSEEERAAQPLAGSVFRVTGLAARGFAAPTYDG